MALGLPTLASPLDAYAKIIRTGQNGYIFKTDSELRHYLGKLRDPAIRKAIGQAAKQDAKKYHIDEICKKWMEILTEEWQDKSVDIIVTTYGGGKYLEECLKSIKECTEHPHNVIIVDSKPEGLNFSQSLNRGIKQSTAPYVCFLNDDVIVTKGWLSALVKRIQGNVGIVNGLSNCDRGWLHNYDLRIGDVELGPGTTMLTEDHKICTKSNQHVKLSPGSVYNFRSLSTKVYEREWLAFYCTIVSKRLIEQVGLLDEEFRTGSEDLDYCIRASKMGWKCCIDESAFILHFGGVSRKAHEDEDYEKHKLEDEYNNDRIKFKYDKPLIVLHSGLSWSNWNAKTLYTEGLGGSETHAIRMSEELAKLGCRVVCFGPMQSEFYNGVEWKDQDEWEFFLSMNWIDVCIISRYPQFLESQIRAEKKYLMIHDVHPMNDNGLTKKHIESGNLDGVFCLSNWHRDYVSEVCGISKDKIILVSNGIDLKDFRR